MASRNCSCSWQKSRSTGDSSSCGMSPAWPSLACSSHQLCSRRVQSGCFHRPCTHTHKIEDITFRFSNLPHTYYNKSLASACSYLQRSRCHVGTFLYVRRAVTSNMMTAHCPWMLQHNTKIKTNFVSWPMQGNKLIATGKSDQLISY